MSKEKISIEVNMKGDVSKAWKKYTTCDDIMKWNAAHESWHCPKASHELRKGGKFSYTMAARDGSMSFDFEGTFDEVKEEESLQYTLADGRQVKVDFKPHGNDTQVSVVFEAENENPVEMQKQGWQAILNNYKMHTEAE